MQSFWITNYSKQNVTLSDLNITVRSYTSVNLLDQKHYKFTEDQLLKSKESGSLFIKRNKISIRSVTPVGREDKILFDSKSFFKDRAKTQIEAAPPQYFKELDVSDEEMASDNADIEVKKGG